MTYMNRSIEAYPGSPANPEVVGDAQYARMEGRVHKSVAPLEVSRDEYHLLVEEPANTLEGTVLSLQSFPKDTSLTPEQNGLRVYQRAYPEDEQLQDLTIVENSGFLPEDVGVELFFETKSGDYFSSTAPSTEVALQEGVEFYLSQR